MEIQFDGTHTYLNLKTSEVISVSQDDLLAAEDYESFDHLSEWQQESIQVAIDVLENLDDYKELPTKYEINEFEMMEEFCYTLSTPRHKDILLNAIRGRGAFRRFKDHIIHMGIEDQWYAYRDDCYKKIAIEWCKLHNVEYVEGAAKNNE